VGPPKKKRQRGEEGGRKREKKKKKKRQSGAVASINRLGLISNIFTTSGGSDGRLGIFFIKNDTEAKGNGV